LSLHHRLDLTTHSRGAWTRPAQGEALNQSHELVWQLVLPPIRSRLEGQAGQAVLPVGVQPALNSTHRDPGVLSELVDREPSFEAGPQDSEALQGLLALSLWQLRRAHISFTLPAATASGGLV
jgi:hypothetical protein